MTHVQEKGTGVWWVMDGVRKVAHFSLETYAISYIKRYGR